MTNVIFDIVDVAGEVHPGDTVRIWPPRVTRNADGQTVATRPETINVGAGPVTRDISPGPMWVQIQADGYTDTDPKLVRIPEDGEFPDTPTLANLLARVEHYDPVLESWAYENAERAEQAALEAIAARDRSEAGAELSKDSAAVAVAAALGFEGFEPADVKRHADRAESASDEATAARDLITPLADQVTTDAATTAANRAHVDAQTAAIDTAFTESIPPYLQPDAPGGLAETYGTKGYIHEAAGEVATLMDPPRSDATIADALPSVTLSQVQALDPEANLDDTADWFLVQRHISECAANNTKAIRLPRGRYYMSRGIDLSALDYGTYINAEGAIFWAIKAMPRMVWLQHRGNYWKGRRADIHGLELRGNYLAQRGIDISGVQEWSVDIRVHTCYEGISLQDVWYGNFSRETVIQDCLTGLAFNDGNTMEINAIGIDNLKINFATSKENFVDDPESDSIGISISTILGGIDFHSITVEGTDYGVRYMPMRTGSGYMEGLVMFTGCYWESIRKRVFDFSRINELGFTHCINSLVIQGNRFFVTSGESVMGPGKLTMVGNQKHKIRFANFRQATRMTVNIDENVEVVHKFDTNYAGSLELQLALNTGLSVVNNVDWKRFSPWGDTNSYPLGDQMVSTIGHENYRIGAGAKLLRGPNQPSKYFAARSIMPRPIVFYPGSLGEPNGPVVRGDDGKWHMIQVNANGDLTTREVRNTHRLDEGPSSRTAKELHFLKDSDPLGSRYQCIDFSPNDSWVNLAELDGKRHWVDDSGRLRIGNTEEALEAYSKLVNGLHFFDMNTGQSLSRLGDGFYLIDWYGVRSANRVYGTAAQRPSSPVEGLIYYATDTAEYTVYRSGEWSPFTPIVTG